MNSREDAWLIYAPFLNASVLFLSCVWLMFTFIYLSSVLPKASMPEVLWLGVAACCFVGTLILGSLLIFNIVKLLSATAKLPEADKVFAELPKVLKGKERFLWMFNAALVIIWLYLIVRPDPGGPWWLILFPLLVHCAASVAITRRASIKRLPS